MRRNIDAPTNRTLMPKRFSSNSYALVTFCFMMKGIIPQPTTMPTKGKAMNCVICIGPCLIISPGTARYDSALVSVANKESPTANGLIRRSPSR